jgi:hypothetical protein
MMGLLIFIGNKVVDRYPNGSVVRDRAEMALGCSILALPGVPLILFIGLLIVRNPRDPIIQLIEAFGLFWAGSGLIFGALVKFSWMRKAVATIYNQVRALLFAN